MGIWVSFCLGVGGVEDERSRLGCRGVVFIRGQAFGERFKEGEKQLYGN